MARQHLVKKSRKSHICGTPKGRHEIPVGEDYYWAAPGFRGRKQFRCTRHRFRPSELTTSAASIPLAAVEAFEDQVNLGFDSVEDLQSAWEEVQSAAEEYHSDRESALDAWENGNSTLEELRDRAEEAMNEIQGHDIEDFDEDEPEQSDFMRFAEDEDGNETDSEVEDTDAYEAAHAEWEENLQEHITEQANEALGIAQGVEF